MRSTAQNVLPLVRSISSLAVLFAVFLHPLPSSAELIDRIVATVNAEVITLSELNQAAGFNRMLNGGSGGNLRAETLEGLVNRLLLIQEARRLKFVEVSEQDVIAEIEKLRDRIGTKKELSDFLARIDLTTGQLSHMLGERLLVQRFIEKKIGLYIRVARDEAHDFFNRNAERFKGKSFQEVQKAITAGLQEQKLEQQISGYLAELKSRSDVRMQLQETL